MFCGNCGTQNEDNVPFCGNCGARLQEDPASPFAPPVRRAKRPNKKGLIAIIAAVVAVALALVLIFTITTPKSVAKKFCKAVENGNAKTIFKLFPQKALKEAFDDKDEKNEAIEELQEILDEVQEYIDEYDLEISYKVTDVEEVDDDELEELQEVYEEAYDCKVKAAKVVTIELTVEYDGEEEEYELELCVIKVGGRWNLEIMSAYSFIYRLTSMM